MNPTEIRETLIDVLDGTPVPVPDPVAFERRVRGVRRRRTAGRAAGAALAVAVVAGGSALALGDPATQSAHRGDPAHQAVVEPVAGHPVVIQGRLRSLSPGGILGSPGPAVAHVVGETSLGVVTFAADGRLVRVASDGTVVDLVTDRVPVRTAYLDGDAVVYENFDGLVRWLGIDPDVQPHWSAQVEQGRLMAAGQDTYVVAGDDGLVAHDADGVHPLWLGDQVQTIRGVDVGGGKVAVRTEDGLEVIDADGLHSGGIPGDRLGEMSPDGTRYARQTASRDGVELLDTTSFAATPVAGPDGPVVDLAWPSADELWVVVRQHGASTLWSCAGGTDCSVLLDDPTGTLRLS